MKILLARHGETPWNAEGRYQGRRDIPLSPVGEAQALALGERLRPVPISRAVASSQPGSVNAKHITIHIFFMSRSPRPWSTACVAKARRCGAGWRNLA